MNITLLPEKHVRSSESLLGLGAIVLSLLDGNSKNIDTLWNDLKEIETVKHRIHGSVTLDNVVLAVDFLFSIGALSLNEQGLLEHAST